MSVTCKDIARMVGVSRQAAASVLNDSPVCLVSKEKKEKILMLARELRYVPNNAARILKGKPQKIIGSVLDGFGGVGACRQEYLAMRLYMRGYTLQTVFYTGALQARHALDFFAGSGVAALLFPHYIFRELRHEDFSIPVIITDGEDIGDTFIDYGYGCQEMTKHLIWHGHRRICFLCAEAIFGSALGYQGYANAMKEAGFSPLPPFEVIGKNSLPEMIHDLVRRKKITAFLCNGDSRADQLIMQLTRDGIRVPEDVAVTGFGGVMTPRGIATIIQPIQEDVNALETILFHKIRKNILKRYSEPYKLKPYLYTDRSCGCPYHEEISLENHYSPMSYDLSGRAKEMRHGVTDFVKTRSLNIKKEELTL